MSNLRDCKHSKIIPFRGGGRGEQVIVSYTYICGLSQVSKIPKLINS
jgi:hypothetical protein